MSADLARTRRMHYHRSLTVPAPVTTQEVDNAHDELEGLLHDRVFMSGKLDSKSSSHKHSRLRSSGPSPAESTCSTPGTSSNRRVRPPLLRRNTVISGEAITDREDKCSNQSNMFPPSSTISRSTSTPSVILNKVKERIRRHVVQTSDWPPPSSVLREHYCKRRNSLPEQTFPITQHSEPKLESLPLESADQFSKVSRSSRSPRPQRYRRKSPPSERCSSESSVKTPTGGGVICSKDDLRAIMCEFKQDTNRRAKLQKSHTVSTGTTPCESPSISSIRSHTSLPLTRLLLKKQVSFDAGEDDTDQDEASTPKYTSYDVAPRSSVPTTPTSIISTSEPNIRQIACRPTKLIKIKTQSTDAYYDLKSSLNGEDNPRNVKDIIFDEHGQTWEVYGAEFDPEIVGGAIQRHLESLIVRNTSGTPPLQSLACQDHSKRPRVLTLDQINSKMNGNGPSRSMMSWFCLFGRDG